MKGAEVRAGWEGSVRVLYKPDSVSASIPGNSEADGSEEGSGFDERWLGLCTTAFHSHWLGRENDLSHYCLA